MSILPAGYTELTYIQTSGQQYIDTGVTPNNNTNAVLSDLVILAFSRYGTFLGEGNSSGRIWAVRLRDTSHRIQIQVGGDSTYAQTGVDLELNTSYNVTAENGSITVNSVTYTGTAGSISNPMKSLHLFSNGYGENASCRLRVCKIYDGSTLLREMYAAKRNSDNVFGMYDTVNDVFYTNSGGGSFVAGDPVIDTYTVVYDSNGGYGVMSDQIIEVDVPTQLSRNQFARDGYMFTGWALTPNGIVMYPDGATVTNLTAADETITLFAVWKTGFGIDIQINYSDPICLDKDIETIMSLSGTLKSETSIIDPVILVHGDIDILAGANYMTIPVFGRRYYINNIRSIRTGLVEISAHVDVLTTYAAGIRGNTGIIRRQAHDWNLYLNDGSLRVYQNEVIQTKAFPSGFNAMEFVLAVAGS